MSEKPAGSSGEADNVDRIHQLVRMMRKYDLMAIDLVEGPTKIRLRRRGPEVPGQVAYMPMHSAPAAPVAAPPPQAAAPAATPAAAPAAAAKGTFIESPMVGTFYASSSPDAAPFIAVGAVVRPETVVCIIEAMKVFTEIPAGVSGTVVEILAKDKQSVEFGQPLFRVEPS